MKRKLIAVMAILMIIGLVFAACKPQEGTTDPKTEKGDNIVEKETELIVFAAASMTETLTKIGNLYTAKHPNVKIVFNFDSSGTLKKQIQEGAQCDLFVSAGQKQMNQIDIKADKELNKEGLDLIDSATRINILENKLALAVAAGNPAKINSYDDLVKALKNDKILLAIGNADVPVGQYSQKIFKHFELDEDALAKAGKLTYGSNVKEVVTQIAEATVDAGIIYATDAASAKLTVVDTATKEMCGQAIYPAAVLKDAKNPTEAKAFLDFLGSKEAIDVFTAVGFSPVK